MLLTSSVASSALTAAMSTSPTLPVRIFLDMDGVLCDFEKKVKSIMALDEQVSLSDITPKRMWGSISQYRRQNGGFYSSLDWIDGGHELWGAVSSSSSSVSVLTGCPMGGWGGAEKASWVRRNLLPNTRYANLVWSDSCGSHASYGEVPHEYSMTMADVPADTLLVQTCWSRKKQEYCFSPSDILVDDRADIGERWEDAGGIFVHHVGDVGATLDSLRSCGVMLL